MIPRLPGFVAHESEDNRIPAIGSISPNAHAASVGIWPISAIFSSPRWQRLINPQRSQKVPTWTKAWRQRCSWPGECAAGFAPLVPAALKIAGGSGDFQPLQRNGLCRPLPARLARRRRFSRAGTNCSPATPGPPSLPLPPGNPPSSTNSSPPDSSGSSPSAAKNNFWRFFPWR